MSTTFTHPRRGVSPDRWIAGCAFVGLGVLLFFQQAGYPLAGQIISGWWPAVIVLLGAAHLFTSRGPAIGPLVVVLVGLVLLAGSLELVPGGALALIWPLILVAIGLSILAHRSGAPAPAVARMDVSASDENHLALSAAFSAITHLSRATRFQSASLRAWCGAIILDLRQATLDPAGATIDVTATCSGVEIRVPPGWQVEMTGTPFLGGYDCKELENDVPLPDAPRLRVIVAATLAGVTVKH